MIILKDIDILGVELKKINDKWRLGIREKRNNGKIGTIFLYPDKDKEISINLPRKRVGE